MAGRPDFSAAGDRAGGQVRTTARSVSLDVEDRSISDIPAVSRDGVKWEPPEGKQWRIRCLELVTTTQARVGQSEMKMRVSLGGRTGDLDAGTEVVMTNHSYNDDSTAISGSVLSDAFTVVRGSKDLRDTLHGAVLTNSTDGLLVINFESGQASESMNYAFRLAYEEEEVA